MYKLEVLLVGDDLKKHSKKIESILINISRLRLLDERLLDTRVTHFRNARLAVEYAFNNHPDIILIKKVMPYLDGISFIQLVKEQYNHNRHWSPDKTR